MNITVSSGTLTTAGILLIAIVAVETGGYYLVAIDRGRRALTPFQVAFARAGHAHAGVLVILSLVAQLYVDAAGLTGPLGWLAREGIPVAAILMPAGFFFSSAGRDRQQPSVLIWLLYAGTVSLAAGVLALGIGLILA